jgi:hypothetical protein
LIQAEALAQSLKPGRPSRLLDDRFDLDASRDKSSGSGTGVGVKQNETGPMILNITKDLTREIFEEFPVVQDAYARYVPGVRVPRRPGADWADKRGRVLDPILHFEAMGAAPRERAQINQRGGKQETGRDIRSVSRGTGLE